MYPSPPFIFHALSPAVVMHGAAGIMAGLRATAIYLLLLPI